mgnify:CR=1 FL=1
MVVIDKFEFRFKLYCNKCTARWDDFSKCRAYRSVYWHVNEIIKSYVNILPDSILFEANQQVETAVKLILNIVFPMFDSVEAGII